MKICISTYSFTRYMRNTPITYFQMCDLVKGMGYDAIEFVGLDLNVQPAESVPALARAIREYCEKIGLPIACYTVGADFLKNPNALEACKFNVDIAAILGAPVYRHGAFGTLPEGMTWRQGIEKVAPQIRELAAYAQEKGVRTCTENHGLVLEDAERMEELIRAVNHPNYGWLVDIGNFLCADDSPLRAVAIAAPYAFHVHIKDVLFKPFDADDPGEGWSRTRAGAYLRNTMVGHGVVPVRRCLEILKDAGYPGVVSYEFEGIEDTLLALERGLAFLRKAI